MVAPRTQGERIVHNTSSPLADVKGNPAIAEQMRDELPNVLGTLNEEVGDRPTIPDHTLFGAWEFGRVSGVEFEPEMENLHRWHESLLRRPSARSNPDPSAASGGRSWPSSDALLRSVSDG